MRISDWSSDVCSSDLQRILAQKRPPGSRVPHHPTETVLPYHRCAGRTTTPGARLCPPHHMPGTPAMSQHSEASRSAAVRAPSVLRRIPAGIWALGMVSMLMDTSSEMIHALLPVYLVSVLGASALAVGLIEGIAESTEIGRAHV